MKTATQTRAEILDKAAEDTEAAQTDVVAFAVDGDSLDPVLRTASLHIQVACAAVAVPAGLGERFPLAACQASRVVPTSVLTFEPGI